MLKTLINAFKIKDIRKKLLFTLGMLVVIRFGSQLPVPGVTRDYFSSWFENMTGGAFSFIDAFTGGSFLSMSLFALNITPYITSSIIMQLLTIAIPKLEEMQREGEDGRKKIASITRYVTVGLALVQSTAMAVAFGSSGLLQAEAVVLDYVSVITALTAGSAFLMWIGERITENGVGNGISIVLVINIISRFPSDLSSLYTQFMKGQIIPKQILSGVIILAIFLFMIVIVVLLNAGVRKIPVQYAKKVQGNKMVGGNTTFIPLKVNTAGVIPIIFASSFLQFPLLIVNLFGISSATGFWGHVLKAINSDNWISPANWWYSLGLLAYVGLIIFFAYFYTNITFNPMEVANNMKKHGGFIPGIRPGRPTSDYLTKVLNYIIFIGACGLTFVGILPFVFNGVFNADISFAGTSLIIVVSVVLETMKQVESQMLVRNYKGFLND